MKTLRYNFINVQIYSIYNVQSRQNQRDMASSHNYLPSLELETVEKKREGHLGSCSFFLQ
jgi:hypothetical protein